MGSIAEFGFYERAIVTKYRIEALKPGEYIKWISVDGPNELAGSVIEYKIVPTGNKTKLEMNNSELNGGKELIIDFIPQNLYLLRN